MERWRMFSRPHPLTAAIPGTSLTKHLLTYLSHVQRQWKDIKPRYLAAAAKEEDDDDE